MSDETPVVVESLEKRLIKKHVENIKTLVERKAAIDDQIKVLNGAIAGLNDLLEQRELEAKAAVVTEVTSG